MVRPEIVLAGNIVDPDKLKQVTYNVSKNKKFSLLIHLLKQDDKHLTMVFCNTRKITDFIEYNLRSNGIKVAAIHGGLTQNKRLSTIDRFNSKEVNVLVCTDVAARGLHIKNISHIINYDLPSDPNDYIHRIGRTARAGESGQVINLLTNFDEDAMTKIKRNNKSFNIETLATAQFNDVAMSKPRKRVGQRKKTLNSGKRNGNKMRNKANINNGRKFQRKNNKKGQWQSHKKNANSKKTRYGSNRSNFRKNNKKVNFQYKNKMSEQR